MTQRPPTSPTKAESSNGRTGSRAAVYLRRLVDRAPRRLTVYFTRQRLIEFLKNLSFVIPLTLLIWIYAEREQQASEGAIISVEARSTSPNRQVRLTGERSISAELLGPRAKLDAVLNILTHPTENDRIDIPVDPALGPGAHEVTSALIANNALFREYGVAVTNCRPEKLGIYIDEIEERDLKVMLPPGKFPNLEGTPTFEPQTVRYRGPRRLLISAEAQGVLYAVADPSDRPGAMTPGPHTEKALPVHPAFTYTDEDRAMLTPSTVDVTFALRAADREFVYRSVPVLVTGLPDLLKRYDVVLESRIVANIRVVGPPQVIDLISRPDSTVKPQARLLVQQEDVGLPKHAKRLALDLPEGVRLAQGEEPPSIDFQLQERSATE